MRNFDFSPLSRSTIGFERLFDLINDNQQRFEDQGDYPPYDIIRTGEETFQIYLAVAGFSPDDITITAQQNLLKVAGRRPDNEARTYLHQGISAGAFEREFSLADHVKVQNASYDNGLLRIELVHEIPEAMKPRTIKITEGNSKSGPMRAVS